MAGIFKALLVVFVLSAVGFLAPTVLALDTGVNYGTALGLGTKDVREGIMSIINALFGFLGVIAIVGILAGGFIMMTAGGNSERTGEGQKVAVAGVVGLVIIFVSYALASFVIQQLISATGAN